MFGVSKRWFPNNALATFRVICVTLHFHIQPYILCARIFRPLNHIYSLSYWIHGAQDVNLKDARAITLETDKQINPSQSFLQCGFCPEAIFTPSVCNVGNVSSAVVYYPSLRPPIPGLLFERHHR